MPSVKDQQLMATNVVSGGAEDPGDEMPSRPLPASAPNRTGFFAIYKSGQGYWTRMGTVGGAVLVMLLTLTFLYQQVPVLLRSFVTPHTDSMQTVEQIRAANDHANSIVTDSTVAICAVFLLGFAALTFWLINKPSNADFLIATDSEMKKVNWTSREELIGSTKVVIGFMFMIAFLLFALDVLFGYFFKLITVLKAGPFG